MLYSNIQALIDVIEAVNWTHILIMVDDQWSEGRVEALLRTAGQHRICVVKVFKLHNTVVDIKDAVIETMEQAEKGWLNTYAL